MSEHAAVSVPWGPNFGIELPGGIDVAWADLVPSSGTVAIATSAKGDPVWVDVRAPKEFAEDHIPGAVSVPLFDDQERAVVGTIYRWEGGGAARQWGLERVTQRLDAFTERLLAALELTEDAPARPGSPGAADERPRVIVCARGGQRSGAVAAYLRARGHSVYRLTGGHRSYRHAVRAALSRLEIPGPIALNGLTGCGKTHVLRSIRERYPRRVIDLEGLAGHRSSVLGDVGLEPATQKQFEARLAQELSQLEGPWTVFEWEARRIGNRELPAEVYTRLRAAPQIELRASIAQRVRILADDYLACGGIEEVKRRLPLLASFPAVGPDGVERLTRDLDAGRVHEVVTFLLANHYDPRYHHGNQGLERVHTVELGTFSQTADAIVRWIEARS
ncbi:MAG: tRNA 2-selenouridine(34) synthase MnmH [Planctomycetota bacterium]